jgi:hypothetical protein
MKLRIMNYKLRKFQSGFIKFTKRTLVSYLIISIVFFGTGLIYLFNPFGTSRADAAWFNDNWAYRKAITVTNSSDFTDRFVHFNIDTTEAPEKFQTDCGDIRFTDINGNILDYYYNTGADQCDNAGTDFYVNLNTILNGTMTVYMYYGNPSVVNGYLEGDFQGADVVVDDISYASEEKGPSPIAYWKFDDGQGSTTEDGTSNNKDGSITGGITWITEDQCLAGKCIDKPNASGSFVTVASPNLPTGDFTYSGWVNLKNNDTETLFNSSNGSATNELSINITTTKVATYTDGTLRVTSTNAVSTNTWTHIAVVRSGSSGSNIKIYINGSQDPTAGSDSGAALNFGSCRLMIGATDASSCSGTTTSANLGGRMDEFKIYNQALTANQIKALYNSSSNLEGLSTSLGKNIQNSPGSLSNGLVGYWKMDESSWTVDCSTTSVTDSSGNGQNGKSCPSSTGPTGGAPGKFGYGGLLDGNGDGANVADSTILDIGSDNITLSQWFKRTGNSNFGDGSVLIDKNNGNTTAGYRLALSNNANCNGTDGSAATKSICFIVSDGTNSYIIMTTAIITADSIWHHVAAVFDRTNPNKTGIYLDGIKLTTTDTGTAANVGSIASTNGLGLGRDSDNLSSTSSTFNGSLDETRIYNRALSPTEVSQLYNFAPGPVGYWKMDEGTGSTAIDSSGNGYSANWSGTPMWSNGKYGKSAKITTRNTDFMSANTTLVRSFPFTMSAWVNTTYTTNPQDIFILGSSTANVSFYSLQVRETNGVVRAYCFNYDTNTTAIAQSTVSVNDGKWHFINAVFTSDTSRYIYVDGVLAGSDTTSCAFDAARINKFAIGRDTDLANGMSNSSVDEVKIYNYARNQAQIIEDMNAGHPAPGSPVSSAIAHWKLDEGYGTSAQDYSSNSNTLTLSSATSAWTNSGKFNKAWNGNGTLYLSRADDSDFDVSATDDYSISLWYKSDNASNPGATEYLFNKANATTAGYAIYANTSGNLCFAIDDDTTWSPDVASCTSTDVYDATWHHIVAVRNVTADTTAIYVDGNLRDSDSDTTSATLANSLSLYVGDRDGTDNGDEFNGDLDEIKVYRSALTADQVKIDMNRSSSEVLGAMGASSDKQPQSAANEYCPPDSSTTACTGPVGEWKLDEKTGTTAYDSSGNGFTGTLTNSPRWTNGKYNSGADFSGSTQYITVSDNASLKPNSITVEFWMYLKNGSDTNARLIDKSDNTNSGYRFVKHQNTNDCSGVTSNDKISFQINTASLAMECINTASAVSQNTWTHITGTYDGSTIAIYVDGKLSNSRAAVGGNLTYTNTATLDFGSDGGVGFPFVGTLDNIRIFNYARTPAQVAWDYNKGLPVGYWKMDECQGTTINDASGNGNSGTLTIGASGSNTAVGTCQTSGAWFDGATGKRNYSMDFDGTDDYINVPYNSIFGITQNITLSAWIKKSADGDFGGIVSKTNGIDTWDYDFYVCTDAVCGEGRADYLSFYSDAEGALFSNIKITGTNWHHVAVTRTGSTATIYVDGIPAGSDSFYNSAFNNNSLPIRIGTDGPTYDADSSFNGQIDDVRIYNYGLTHTQIKSLFNEGATRFGPATGAP